jgi:hypothetical protein
MKTPIAFIAGAVATGAAVLGVQSVLSPSQQAGLLPNAGTAVLQYHDAAGRSSTASATLNALKYDNGTLTVTYTSDAMFCSAFGP